MPEVQVNPQQQQAITHGQGPIIVVAGAGTGKTTVITERIKHLITQKNVQPEEILALTFSDKAAEEMLKRVDVIMPLGYEEPWLSTFHAFCDRILKTEAIEIGLDSSYHILSTAQQWILIRKHLFELGLNYYLPLATPTKFISSLLSFFSRAKDELIKPDDLEKLAKKRLANLKKSTGDIEEEAEKEEIEKLAEVTTAYANYQKFLLAENSLDFGDLLLWTIELFKKRPSVLLKYQKQFKYLLVDEFQDTNSTQFELIKLLAPVDKNPNLMVVGDDDQSIYKFRGAAISNILEFKNNYQKSQTVVLTTNYRSTQKILNTAYNLIQNNNPERLEIKLGINKKLTSYTNNEGKYPSITSLDKLTDETNYIAHEIAGRVNKGKNKFSDFAILARANNHLDHFVVALKRLGLPYTLLGNRGLFDQEEVRGIISFLRFLVNQDDSVSLYQLLISPIFSFTSPQIISLMDQAKRKNVPVWEVLQEEADNKQENCEECVLLVKTLKEHLPKRSVSQILYEFLTKTPYLKSLLKEETIENNLKIKNINLFFDKVKSFESQTTNSSLYEFVQYLDLLIEAGDNPAQAEIEDVDTIKLLTIHSAKGLEFPMVYLVNLVSDRFPSRERKELIPLPDELVKEKYLNANYHLQEERRLLYVGITRAQEELTLTWAKNYGGIRDKKPSGFLSELKLPHEINLSISSQQLSLLETEESIFEEKDIVIKTAKKPVKYVSFSQLETFRTCPLKYFYKYVVGIPGIPSHVLSFGQTLHRTLRDFHKNNLPISERKLEELLHLYAKHFINFGYDNKEHRELRFRQGEEVVRKYFEEYENYLTGKPILIEKSFRVNLAHFYLLGSIDRIDLLPDKSYEIIDYKTGSGSASLKKEEAVDKDEQLTIYALAAKEAKDIKIEVDHLSLLFVERMSKATAQKKPPVVLAEEKEKIIKTVEDIDSRDPSPQGFPAKVGPHCTFCEFNKICPAYKVGQNIF